MAKIVYNNCFGVFGLSEEARLLYTKFTNGSVFDADRTTRHDPSLVRVVEELGYGANGPYALLDLDEVPNGTLYKIVDYNGKEQVETLSSFGFIIAEGE